MRRRRRERNCRRGAGRVAGRRAPVSGGSRTPPPPAAAFLVAAESERLFSRALLAFSRAILAFGRAHDADDGRRTSGTGGIEREIDEENIDWVLEERLMKRTEVNS